MKAPEAIGIAGWICTEHGMAERHQDDIATSVPTFDRIERKADLVIGSD